MWGYRAYYRGDVGILSGPAKSTGHPSREFRGCHEKQKSLWNPKHDQKALDSWITSGWHLHAAGLAGHLHAAGLALEILRAHT